MDDIVLSDVCLYDGDRLELAIVTGGSGATARRWHERTFPLGTIVEPRAVVIVGRTGTAAAFQLDDRKHTHTHTHTHTQVRIIPYYGRSILRAAVVV